MKCIHTILGILTGAAAVTGCVKEDNSDCPPQTAAANVTLSFSLLDRNQTETLHDNIETIDLVLFGGDGYYHSWHELKTSDLGESRSISLHLDPGTYYVVAWGNIYGNDTMTELLEGMTYEDGIVVYNSSESGDPLYYGAPLDLDLTRTFNPDRKLIIFNVPENEDFHETIYFKHAHKEIDVYVLGYSVDGQLPLIEIDGDHMGYDFYMNHLDGDGVCLRQSTERTVNPYGTMAFASFYTSRLKYDNSITINIINPVTEATDYSVALCDVLDSFGEEFDLDWDIVIPVLIEFFEGGVEVRLPDWLKTPVSPGLD